ncbi:hypothetical protein ADUPG1_006476 [Aduncisulcus paluster]|uniref:Arrestin C-terminal-like domain-containing protein n=1 Tax=Aduncisulcus paluster TaxID=2918883 RepID=A0ABQ5KID7_9EUKA|nr:hypothetical protein ADUPG1_006476 [Aduncisulcus paluster]|eukprot:gnl/Carplike_NY0171/5744_a7876_263.p1 GENE.gnl/Carplike_NY0171/5744_a7876_263~~gnl/Carplike_NY0171/5744_a7876_263.p1  ORF type:complete len:713 (+),score=159.07 gnl/Carplike_NY0171/5744_a7876_263:65-2203(+)
MIDDHRIPGISIATKIEPSRTVQPGSTVKVTFELSFFKSYVIKTLIARFLGVERVNIKGRAIKNLEGETLVKLPGEIPKMTADHEDYEDISPQISCRVKERALVHVRQDILPSLISRRQREEKISTKLVCEAGTKKTFSVAFLVPFKLPPTANYGNIATIKYNLDLLIEATPIMGEIDEGFLSESSYSPPKEIPFNPLSLLPVKSTYSSHYRIPINVFACPFLTGSFPRIAESGISVVKEFGSLKKGEIELTTGIPYRIFQPSSRVPIHFHISNTSAFKLKKLTVKLKQKTSMWISPVHKWQEISNISKITDKSLNGLSEASDTLFLDVPPLSRMYEETIITPESKRVFSDYNRQMMARKQWKRAICDFVDHVKRVVAAHWSKGIMSASSKGSLRAPPMGISSSNPYGGDSLHVKMLRGSSSPPVAEREITCHTQLDYETILQSDPSPPSLASPQWAPRDSISDLDSLSLSDRDKDDCVGCKLKILGHVDSTMVSSSHQQTSSEHSPSHPSSPMYPLEGFDSSILDEKSLLAVSPFEHNGRDLVPQVEIDRKILLGKLSLVKYLSDDQILSILRKAKDSGHDVSMDALLGWEQYLHKFLLGEDPTDPLAPRLVPEKGKKKGANGGKKGKISDGYEGLSVSLPSLDVVGEWHGSPSLDFDPKSQIVSVSKKGCFSKGAVSSWYLVDHEIRVYLTLRGGFQKCMQVGMPVLISI